MDRATLKQHLALVEEHVAKSQKHIVRQRELIAELERHAHTHVAEEAKRLLVQFLELDVLHVAHRDRLKQKLDG
jgi:hypothetical protein